MVHFQKIWIMVLDSIYWEHTGGHESTKLNYQLFRKCSVIVIVGNRMEMVTNLFAGSLSNDFVWLTCGTDTVLCVLLKNTQDPARDWKWNQILITQFNKKNIQFVCGQQIVWLACYREMCPFLPQYLSPDDCFICSPSSSIIDSPTEGTASDVIWPIPDQSLFCWCVCCMFEHVWVPLCPCNLGIINLVCSNSVLLLQTFIPNCAWVSLGNSGGRLLWWARGYSAVCWCAASNANEVPMQGAACPFWENIYEESSFDISGMWRILFDRALTLIPVWVQDEKAIMHLLYMTLSHTLALTRQFRYVLLSSIITHHAAGNT